MFFQQPVRPTFTLSVIKLRSSSATAPRTVKTILPVGVVVSICSLRLTNAIPSARMLQNKKTAQIAGGPKWFV